MNHNLDETRFEELYRAHYDSVLGYVLRRAAPEIADDVVAETFVVAWRRRAIVPKEPLPWLLGIARRVLATERRTTRRREAFLGRHAADLLAQPVSEPDATIAARDVLRALKDLRDRDRELLLLVAWEGLTPSGAAEVLGESALVCRVRLHRARRQLARRLAQSNIDDAQLLTSNHAARLRPRQEHT
jgi:RNA polymerase sigma factor (sigma-70 family)